jgi:hypothetical protein
LDPGANEVLTYFGTFNPNSTARFANNPALNITYGLDVFVQLVMAAIATSPVFIFTTSPSRTNETSFCASSSDSPNPALPFGAINDLWKSIFNFDTGTKSCGRFGPATLASIVLKSISTTVVYSGSGFSTR